MITNTICLPDIGKFLQINKLTLRVFWDSDQALWCARVDRLLNNRVGEVVVGCGEETSLDYAIAQAMRDFKTNFP